MIKKNIILSILSISLSFYASSQVGINTDDPKAQLHIRSTSESSPENTDGILIPKIDRFPSINPTVDQNSMIVYLTTIDSDSEPGFYYWNNSSSSWLPFTGSTIEKVNDLIDGKSDDVGANIGSSIFLGLNSGFNDNGDDNRNTALGYGSLRTSEIAKNNSALGYYSMHRATGSNNTGLGYYALHDISGSDNVGVGFQAMMQSSGNRNTGIGIRALNRIDQSDNVAVGYEAMTNAAGAEYNTAVGVTSLASSSGFHNSALGMASLRSSTTGGFNTSLGSYSLARNTAGSENTAVGFQSLTNNLNGLYNVGVGNSALAGNKYGSRNTAIGYQALENNEGVNNIAIGYRSANASALVNNEVVIGNRDNNSYKIFASSWTYPSDRRLKHSIKQIPVGLNLVNKLRPVEFIYNNAKDNNKTYGFIAQEVKRAVKESGVEESVIVINFDETYLGMNQTELIPVLTKAIQEQQKQITELNEKVEVLLNKLDKE